MTDFSSLLIRIVFYLIILTLVRIAVAKIRAASEERSQDATRQFALTEKTAGWIILICSVILSVIILLMCLFPSDPDQRRRGLLFLLPFNLAFYLLAGKFLLYRFVIDPSGVYYRKGMAPGRRYAFAEIAYFETTEEEITILHLQNGKIVKIGQRERGAEIAYRLSRYKVPEKKQDFTEFSVQAPQYLRILFLILSVGMAVLFLLCLAVQYWIGGVIFAVLLILESVIFLQFLVNSIEVNGDRIRIYRIFHKERQILPQDITAFERKKENNADRIIVYSGREKLFTYYTSDKNAFLLNAWLERRKVPEI